MQNDARTGIQRVVRALLLQLLSSPPAGYRICPVFATRQHDYRYAPDFLRQEGSAHEVGDRVKVRDGDIFLGLDLAAHLLPRHQVQLASWKRLGASLHIVVYDLLPLQHPEWFNPRTSKNFHRWIKTVAVFADSAICISNSVKAELTEWLVRRYGLAPDALPIGTILLGADIDASLPSHGLLDDSDRLLAVLREKPSVLMVSTLEPRKGHAQALAAFEYLWQQGQDINLVIVGKPGWRTEQLQHRLRTHSEGQHRLYWLENVSDEMLEHLYTSAKGVLVASEAEGFGLPLIEAIRHRKPVLARDLPVFREIAGDGISFFSGGGPESLAKSLGVWLDSLDQWQPPCDGSQTPTWEGTSLQLLDCLGLSAAKPIGLAGTPTKVAYIVDVMA
jgi:glycosyltransferase involved in cell wall biosynthesis